MFALLLGQSVRDRFWAVVVGAFFVIYGVYVANQTSGISPPPGVNHIVLPFAVAGSSCTPW